MDHLQRAFHRDLAAARLPQAPTTPPAPVTFAKVVPMVGHDTYLRGHGRMLGKVLGLVTVADGSGPTFDLGELVTWLNDAVLVCPSMLLRAPVRWTEVGDTEFDLTLADSGHEVTARITLGPDDLPADFSTTDRFIDLPDGPQRCRWTTPTPEWNTQAGHLLPGATGATWHLPDGPFTYIEGSFAADSLAFDVPPPTDQ